MTGRRGQFTLSKMDRVAAAFKSRDLKALTIDVGRIWFALIAFFATVACSADTSRENSTRLSYFCSGGRSFSVEAATLVAVVQTEHGLYPMEARPSSMGRKYQSDAGTLIIDEDFAALVLKKESMFKECYEKSK